SCLYPALQKLCCNAQAGQALLGGSTYPAQGKSDPALLPTDGRGQQKLNQIRWQLAQSRKIDPHRACPVSKQEIPQTAIGGSLEIGMQNKVLPVLGHCLNSSNVPRRSL
ncbi:MAG: hypothetical protein ACOH2M_20665, partial [Cypionkella sp.]